MNHHWLILQLMVVLLGGLSLSMLFLVKEKHPSDKSIRWFHLCYTIGQLGLMIKDYLYINYGAPLERIMLLCMFLFVGMHHLEIFFLYSYFTSFTHIKRKWLKGVVAVLILFSSLGLVPAFIWVESYFNLLFFLSRTIFFILFLFVILLGYSVLFEMKEKKERLLPILIVVFISFGFVISFSSFIEQLFQPLSILNRNIPPFLYLSLGYMVLCLFFIYSVWSKVQKTEKKDDMSIDWKLLQFLTKREKEIGSLILQGYSNQELAEKLSISKSTVKTHIWRIYKKCKVKNRLQFMLYMKKHE